MNKNLKKFYAFGTYKPNKMAKPVIYKGTEYLSKAQCMALEGITRKELDAYLKGEAIDLPKQEDIPEEIMNLDTTIPEQANPVNKLDVLDDDAF